MGHDFYDKMTDPGGIAQGVIASALFALIWWALKKCAWPWTIEHFKLTKAKAKREFQNQEYVYRKYTSRNGMNNYLQGYLLSITRALQYIAFAIFFLSLAVVLAGRLNFFCGFFFGTGSVFCLRALSWLRPHAEWVGSSNLENWKRIAELELELEGGVDRDTAEKIKAFEIEASAMAKLPKNDGA